MKITNVTTHMSRKVSKNFGSYENGIGLTAELAEGDNHVDAITQLQKECLRHLLKANPFEEAAKRKIAPDKS